MSANIDFMNSNYLGLTANNTQNNPPVSNNNFQSNFQGALNLNQGFQSNAYGNINLSSNNYATENVFLSLFRIYKNMMVNLSSTNWLI